jgi:hypothetical protein
VVIAAQRKAIPTEGLSIVTLLPPAQFPKGRPSERCMSTAP